jgi:hypothetical protein
VVIARSGGHRAGRSQHGIGLADELFGEGPDCDLPVGAGARRDAPADAGHRHRRDRLDVGVARPDELGDLDHERRHRRSFSLCVGAWMVRG